MSIEITFERLVEIMRIQTIDKAITQFSKVKYGTCFFCHGLYYMKIDGVETMANAVNLETGVCGYFLPSEKVIPVNIVGRVQNDSNTQTVLQ